MQFQSRADDVRTGRVQQADRRGDDAFEGGDTPRRRPRPTPPWKVGTLRLWQARESDPAEK